MDSIRVSLQEEDFDLGREVSRLKALGTGVGGLVFFLGTARDETSGKTVAQLEFEAYHEMALTQLGELAARARDRFGLKGLTILHRTGIIRPGENIVLIIAAAAHRREAFEAARWCIDELKKIVPIWKKESYDDGQVWVQETP